jgi:hypothetical protein
MSFNDEQDKWVQDLWSGVHDHVGSAIESTYEIVSDGRTDRYGSFDMTFARRDEEAHLDRFVVISVMPVALAGSAEPWCVTELWAGAEQEAYGGRQQVMSRYAIGSAGVLEVLSEARHQAFARAERLTVADLEWTQPTLQANRL